MSSAYQVPDGEEEPPEPLFDSSVLCDATGRAQWMPELVLGVPLGADDSQIFRARRNLQRDYHPDRPTGDADASRLINDAASLLLKHREAYEEWSGRGTIPLQLARAAIEHPLPFFSIAKEPAWSTLASLLARSADNEARSNRRRREAATALQLLQQEHWKAEHQIQRLEEELTDSRLQVTRLREELAKQQASTTDLQTQLCRIRKRLRVQSEALLAGQLAEARATEASERKMAAAILATRTEAKAETAAAIQALRADLEAEAEAALRSARAQTEAFAAAAVRAALTQAEADAASARAQAEAATAAAGRAQAEIAAAAAERAAVAEAAAETAAPCPLTRDCLTAIITGCVNSAIRRKALYVLGCRHE